MVANRSMFPLFVSEFIGTALLLAVGLSVVIFNWGEGSLVTTWIPGVPLRRAVTGFLFGCTGCIISLGAVGKISGAHINPAVSIAFWLSGKMTTPAMIGYVISQMAGAVTGSVALLLWKHQGASIHYGNTVAGAGGWIPAYVGEAVTTAALITVIFTFAGSKKWKNRTPFAMPFLYSFMVWAETALSGCSTNPARSFGPAVISNVFDGYWLYWAGPLTGAILIVVVFRLARIHKYHHIEAARVSHHEQPTHACLKRHSEQSRLLTPKE